MPLYDHVPDPFRLCRMGSVHARVCQ